MPRTKGIARSAQNKGMTRSANNKSMERNARTREHGKDRRQEEHNEKCLNKSMTKSAMNTGKKELKRLRLPSLQLPQKLKETQQHTEQKNKPCHHLWKLPSYNMINLKPKQLIG
jgi:hypothetical protein